MALTGPNEMPGHSFCVVGQTYYFLKSVVIAAVFRKKFDRLVVGNQRGEKGIASQQV
jgi:hypothetical protein